MCVEDNYVTGFKSGVQYLGLVSPDAYTMVGNSFCCFKRFWIVFTVTSDQGVMLSIQVSSYSLMTSSGTYAKKDFGGSKMDTCC